ncbi:alanine--tRNA ligase [Candidatus Omnitrophota bacterium]
MKVDEIRDRFLRFFEERGHTIYPSDSLVPTNDPTLLFTGAGMNQFKEEFLGRVKGNRRAATSQKCLRTGDLENVGKTPDHHTFFEMLGNFSFGDYFKKDAILWAWEFLAKELGLKEKDLWVSVYKDDDEAYKIWKDIVKVSEKKILRLGAKDNFWPTDAPSEGPNGPCGPCSEIFFGGPDGVEVWNLVFTQFDRLDDGKLEPLPNKNIDTGMGLERIARVMQGKKTNFEIDLFEPIIKEIKKIVEKEYTDSYILTPKKINAIVDHIRAVTFAIADGVLPSNEERGYVIRKLIRKAIYYGRLSGHIEKPFLYKLVPVVCKVMKKAYPELMERREDIAQVVKAEEERFKNTIQDGQEKAKEMMKYSKGKGVLSGKDAFKLYDTYGVPLDLTQEIAATKNITVDVEGFNRCMEEQRASSKKTSKIKGSIFAAEGGLNLKLPDKTIFIEDKEELKTTVLQVSGNSVFLKETNFYGEKGGQVGDTGWFLKDGLVIAEVTNSIDVAGRVHHEVKIEKGSLKNGDSITAKIDMSRRERIKKNHTATHLLHNALRMVLGQHVRQAGSLVAPDRLRFDFKHFRALTGEELSRIEDIVNENIKKNSAVGVKELDLKDAREEGAIALFGEKYRDTVRMVSVGGYSKELCGGTHVEETGEIGLFKIVSESSIASGVRRIEALSWDEAVKENKKRDSLIKDITRELNTSPDNIIKEIENVLERMRKLDKALERFSAKSAQSNIEEILKTSKKINGIDVIVAELKDLDMGLLRKNSDIIKNNLKSGIFILISKKEDKLSMVLGLKGDLKGAGLDASKILNEIGKDFNIKGGGRADFAQAGGRIEVDTDKILKRTEEVIREYL